ncbi:response regulator [Lysinibacillus fusiformis]|uniref:response regulator n=1 Tax=Lysinibacillus sp. PWR01 TaxID=3342384 RepID=UPI00372D5631
MKIIIVDDEIMAIDVLSIMLKRLTQFQIDIKGAFTNAVDAFLFLEKEAVDLVFLDIEMIDMHGMQVAKQLLQKHPFLQIIFVTAHAQFAVDAFEIEAMDYLLKPVHEKRLIKALNKSQKKWKQEVTLRKNLKDSMLYAHTLGSFYLLDVKHEVVKWRTKKVRELFLYLWSHQKKPVLSALLIEELWPELDLKKATKNLHTSIYQLRKLFKENGIEKAIQMTNNHYQLTLKIESDYDELIQLLQEVSHDGASIQKIINFYEDDFLAQEEYMWSIQLKINLKEKVIQALERYITNPNSKDFLITYNCLQKLLELDEFNEHYMFLLLEFLIKHNKRKKSLDCYKFIKEKFSEIGIQIPQKIQGLWNDYLNK